MVFTSRDTGFTLIEVMVSLAIFLIASMALLPLLLTRGEWPAQDGAPTCLAGYG